MAKERRAHPRNAEKHKLHLTLKDTPSRERGGVKTLTVWTNDVSYGGLQFSSRRQIPVGTVVKLDVECSRPHETFRHVGQVMWVSKEDDGVHYTIGVYFTETSVPVLTAWGNHLTVAATM